MKFVTSITDLFIIKHMPLGCVRIWHFYRTLSRGGHSV